MKKTILLCISIIICFSVMIKSAGEKDNNQFRIINIKNFDSEGSYLPLKTGQKFIIELEGNPTTGYEWFLDNPNSISRDLITPLNLKENNSCEFYRRHNEGKGENEIERVGIGGLYHFKFQAGEKKSGNEILTFVYKRSWSNEGEIRKTINLKVVNLDNADAHDL